MDTVLKLVLPDKDLLGSYLTFLQVCLEDTDPNSLGGIDLTNEIQQISEKLYSHKNLSDKINLQSAPAKLKLWAIIGDEVVGTGTIKNLIKDNENMFLIGYRVKPNQQKLGYGTKICQLLLNYCNLNFGIKQVVSTCNPENRGSRRILEKNGGKLLKIYYRNDGKVIFEYLLDTKF